MLLIITFIKNSITLTHKNSGCMWGGFVHFEKAFQRICSLSEREKCVCASPATLETVEAGETGTDKHNEKLHISPISSFIERVLMFVLHMLFRTRVHLKDTEAEVD